ncbi:MAG: ATP-grasp domain-containing protein [Synechococcales bacterium]|nr:ATP-grasp domain-containing protein [Synechococcales bacterium]
MARTPSVTALVTGVGAPVGVGIIKALRASSLAVRIIGVDCEPLAQGLFRVDRPYVVPSARPDPRTYLNALINICQQEQVDILFSGWEGELPLLANHKAEIEAQTEAILPFAPDATLKALDKWLTFKVLQAFKVPVPDTVCPLDREALAAFRDTHAYPYIIKPRRGSGGRGLVLVQSDEELDFFSRYITDPIVQEQLLPDDQEYTVGTFLQADQTPVGAFSMKRSLSGGLSYRMESNHNPDACAIALQAVAAIGAIGIANVQMRWTPQGFKVFEINPRCSSTTCVRANFGFNEPELAIRHFVLQESPPPPTTRTGICLRFWEELYLPLEAKDAAQQHQYPQQGRILSQF